MKIICKFKSKCDALQQNREQQTAEFCSMPCIGLMIIRLWVQTPGVPRFGLVGGVPLKPQNPYPILRVILVEKGTHF